jgi:replication-associated recombination protein RarA
MKALHNIKDSLTELNNMIGMHSLKNNMVDQILYFIQGLHQSKYHTGDFMHTVLYGPPGTGKTEIAKIMGKIYSKMGLLKNGVFKKVTRSDLIAGYLGQTALKTRDVIKECIGGVLFIDEAYALGNHEKRDSYSKECIDTLCEALSDHKHELIVIIAGYENELNECFFQYNQGLDSRFTWRFKTEPFKPDELYQIFLKKVKENGWTVDVEDKTMGSGWFQKNMDSFPSYGRDIETLFSKIKIVHSRRVFCKPEKEKKKIIGKDLEKGFEIYLQNENIKSKKEKEQFHKMLTSMYV